MTKHRTTSSEQLRLYGRVIPVRAHDNHEKIAEKQKYFRRRVGVAVGGAIMGGAALVGAGGAMNALEDRNPYLVDREKVVTLDPQEQATKYDVLRVRTGDKLIDMAQDYTEIHGGDTYKVLESLAVQARQIDIAAERPINEYIIQPGEVYFIPRG